MPNNGVKNKYAENKHLKVVPLYNIDENKWN